MTERVYQASPATCVKVAREALKEALDELGAESPDLGHVEFHLRTAAAWLPPWLEREWPPLLFRPDADSEPSEAPRSDERPPSGVPGPLDDDQALRDGLRGWGA